MVTGWRRVFCTSLPKEKDSKEEPQQHFNNDTNFSQSPRVGSRFRLFSSNPSTPKLQAVSNRNLSCRTTTTITGGSSSSLPNSPLRLQCKTGIATTPSSNRISRLADINTSSPRSPFSLFKASLGLSKIIRCGICLHSVKTGQGTGVFTAECLHVFHFPCVATHARDQELIACPVCSVTWKEAPFLSVHRNDESSNCENSTMNLPQVKTKPLRVYNDDEPLLSPTALAQFNTIPESEENDLAEEDFQGFFVTPSPITTKFHQTTRDDHVVEVTVLPETVVVSSGRRYETIVAVLKVRAPPHPSVRGLRRIPVDLVTVLDVSGGKLHMMKRAMRSVIATLSETDRLSIIALSASSKRLLPLRRMTTNGRRYARRVVDALDSSGQGMSVNDAIKKAAKVIEDRREKNPVAGIIILTDDQIGRPHTTAPNQNQSWPVISTKRFSHLDIPVHFVSLGAYDHATQKDALARKVRGLLSIAVQDLRLQLGLASGSTPAEIGSVYCITGRPEFHESDSVKLGDLYAGEERELLVELKLPNSSTGSHHIITVRSSHLDTSSPELRYSKEEESVFVPKPGRSSSPTIQRLRNLYVSTRAVAESRVLIERNDLAGAGRLLSSARSLLIQSSSSLADDYLSGLDTELDELSRLMQIERQMSCSQAEEKIEQLTPTSAWRAAEKLAKVAIMRKHMNKVSDLHGFENARF